MVAAKADHVVTEVVRQEGGALIANLCRGGDKLIVNDDFDQAGSWGVEC